MNRASRRAQRIPLVLIVAALGVTCLWTGAQLITRGHDASQALGGLVLCGLGMAFTLIAVCGVTQP